MNGPHRLIATVRTYGELIAVMRARADELKITRETIDAAGLQDGYSAKLLAPIPIKSAGPTSLGVLLKVMGLYIGIFEDPEALAFIGALVKRRRPLQLRVQPAQHVVRAHKGHVRQTTPCPKSRQAIRNKSER